jgi:hypothetical protein
MDKVGRTIAEFLHSIGGMENGYETRVSGTIRRRTSPGHLIIDTPLVRKRTPNWTNEKSLELYGELYAILESSGLERIDLIAEDVGEGAECYRVKMELVSAMSYISLRIRPKKTARRTRRIA